MNQNEKQVPEISLKPDIDAETQTRKDTNITLEDGKNWYRTQVRMIGLNFRTKSP